MALAGDLDWTDFNLSSPQTQCKEENVFNKSICVYIKYIKNRNMYMTDIYKTCKHMCEYICILYIHTHKVYIYKVYKTLCIYIHSVKYTHIKYRWPYGHTLKCCLKYSNRNKNKQRCERIPTISEASMYAEKHGRHLYLENTLVVEEVQFFWKSISFRSQDAGFQILISTINMLRSNDHCGKGQKKNLENMCDCIELYCEISPHWRLWNWLYHM